MRRISNDRAFCWEQALRTSRVFRISHIFAPDECAEKLLPLYAMLSSVEQICATVTEDEVARSKLHWWRNECLGRPMAESDHPVVRELVRSGAAGSLPDQTLLKLFDDAEARLDAPAPTDMAELKACCLNLHLPQLELELSLNGQEGGEKVDPGLSACSGLLQLIRETVGRKGRGGFWWLPLGLLARHGISREAITEGVETASSAQLMRDVISSGVGWGRQGEEANATLAGSGRRPRHAQIIAELNFRQLKRLQNRAPNDYPRVLKQLGLGDLFIAWQVARRC